MQFPTIVWSLNFKFKILVFNLLFIFLGKLLKMLNATWISNSLDCKPIKTKEKSESLDLARNYAMRKWPQVNS